MEYNRTKEVHEAIISGEIALDKLKDAQKDLNSASNWGLVDIFGGNLLSGFMKHSSINDASRKVEDAKRELSIFRNELSDIRDIEGLDIQIDGFLEFADFMFDGIFADVFVQSKIGDFQKQVQKAIDRVQDILFILKRSVNEVVS